MAMSGTSSGRSLDANLSTQLAYVNWFKNAIDYLEAEDCASGDLVTEARKKIGEAVELITVAAGGHDKEKQNKAEDLINEVMHAFFAMLDNCYNKYAGPRMSQMSKSQG
jgi:hypothetical protein